MQGVQSDSMNIALFATVNRPRAIAIVQQIAVWLHDHGHQVRMEPALAMASHCRHNAADTAGIDLAMAIGGDGTMLGAVRTVAPHGVPVLGINAGALGFLTELTPEQLFHYLPHIMDGEYTVESRMMLHGQLYRGDALIAESMALNDIVVHQGAKGRLINLDVRVAGHQLGHFGADGLIFATPTGSTAYGISAGGPIVHPLTSVIVLVPICPHSLSFRPLVIPATDPIEILCESNQHDDEMMLTADGQEPVPVYRGDRIIVQPAAAQARLVKLNLFSYYDRLREKLQWGRRNS